MKAKCFNETNRYYQCGTDSLIQLVNQNHFTVCSSHWKGLKKPPKTFPFIPQSKSTQLIWGLCLFIQFDHVCLGKSVKSLQLNEHNVVPPDTICCFHLHILTLIPAHTHPHTHTLSHRLVSCQCLNKGNGLCPVRDRSRAPPWYLVVGMELCQSYHSSAFIFHTDATKDSEASSDKNNKWNNFTARTNRTEQGWSSCAVCDLSRVMTNEIQSQTLNLIQIDVIRFDRERIWVYLMLQSCCISVNLDLCFTTNSGVTYLCRFGSRTQNKTVKLLTVKL